MLRRTVWMLASFVLLFGFHAAHGQDAAAAVVNARGVVESSNAIEIQNPLERTAAITFIAPEGTAVEKGDVIATLNSAGMNQHVSQARVKLRRAEASLQEAKVELEAVELEGASQFEKAVGQLELVRSTKTMRLGDDGELALEIAVVEGEIVIHQAQIEATKLRLEKDTENDELKLGLKKLQAQLKIAEAKKRFLDGPKRKHETMQLDLAISDKESAAKQVEMSRKRAYAKALNGRDVCEGNLVNCTKSLKRGEERLADCSIIAPRDGVLVAPKGGDGHPGYLSDRFAVRQGDAIVRVADPERLQVKVELQKAKAAKVRVGQAVTVEIDAFSNVKSLGKVAAIQAKGDAKNYESPSTVVIVAVDELPEGAKMGLTAAVQIDVEE